jgi:RsiW-degrading membrane proteinase PrsW (M82 family)
VLLYLSERVFVYTRDLGFLPSIIFLGSFLVPVTFVAYLYERLPDWEVPLPPLAVCFLWGGVLGTVIAGTLEYRTFATLSFLLLAGAGLIEEAAKLIFPLIYYFLGRYRSEADGIILGVSAAMGFAAFETMGYSLVTFLQSRQDLATLEYVLLLRGLASPTGHAAWTGLVCAVLFRERLRAGSAVLSWRIVGAFVTAVLLHALWNIFNSLSGSAMVNFLSVVLSIGVALASLILLVLRIREAIRGLPLN